MALTEKPGSFSNSTGNPPDGFTDERGNIHWQNARSRVESGAAKARADLIGVRSNSRLQDLADDCDWNDSGETYTLNEILAKEGLTLADIRAINERKKP
jgi:hypothetical protein